MDDFGNTSVTYTVMVFDPDKSSGKVFNGQKDSPKRCRFCGRILDASHYSKVAHAISVSLGNTKFFCADECDECNEKFGQKLENDITNFFQIFLSLFQVPKRNGDERQVTGRNFEMQTSSKPHPFSDLPLIKLHMRDWKDEKLSAEDVAEMMKGFDLSNKTYVPQNIYKAICKYALSLMPHSTTLHYQKTIEWIQSDSYQSALPKLKMATINRNGNEPYMIIFLRKTPNSGYPLCVASLCVTNIQMVYVLPLCDESKGVECDNAQLDAFLEQFTKVTGRIDHYTDSDLSNAQRTSLKLDFDLTVENGAEITRLKKDSETGQWTADNGVK